MTREPTIADLRQFMGEAALINRPRGPHVASVAADPAIYARACTYATLGRPLTIEVFRNLGEAERWLTAQAKATEKGEA